MGDMPERVYIWRKRAEGAGYAPLTVATSRVNEWAPDVPYVPEARALAAEAERDALRKRLREAAAMLRECAESADKAADYAEMAGAWYGRDPHQGRASRARALADALDPPGEEARA